MEQFAVATTTIQNAYKVRLISVNSLTLDQTSSNPDMVIFEVTPSFQETGSVEYGQVTPIHMPGGIQIYKRTQSRTFQIGAKFISRTVAEATVNMQYLQTLRSWRMPYFGSSSVLSNNQPNNKTSVQHANAAIGQPVSARGQILNARNQINASGVEMIGAPPNVLYLYAYSTGDNDSRSIPYNININRVPVVLTDLGITYPEDVDYLPTSSNPQGNSITINNLSEPFPIKMDVTITLVETHSPTEYEKFSLAQYKTGQLPSF